MQQLRSFLLLLLVATSGRKEKSCRVISLQMWDCMGWGTLAGGALGDILRQPEAAGEARPQAAVVDHPVLAVLGRLVLHDPLVALVVELRAHLHRVCRVCGAGLWVMRIIPFLSASICSPSGTDIQECSGFKPWYNSFGRMILRISPTFSADVQMRCWVLTLTTRVGQSDQP